MLRRVSSFLLSVFLMTGFALMITTKQAHAYIDLGSGSFILQMLLASFFASLFAIKVYWQRLTGLFSRLLAKMKSPKNPTR